MGNLPYWVVGNLPYRVVGNLPTRHFNFLHTKSASRVGRRYHFIGARYAATPPHLVLLVNPAKGSLLL
nr:MAG TPA: hypothetical protein [Caudoviricetes sp.]